MSDNMKLIELTDTELLNELSSRFDSMIFCGRRKINKKNNQIVERRRFWNGDYDVCIGLLHGAAFDCLSKNWGINESDIKEE